MDDPGSSSAFAARKTYQALGSFVRHLKKPFATISANSGHAQERISLQP
jgi:hypothetical protein